MICEKASNQIINYLTSLMLVCIYFSTLPTPCVAIYLRDFFLFSMLDKPNKLKIKLFFMLKTNFKIYAPQIVMLSQQLVNSLSILY